MSDSQAYERVTVGADGVTVTKRFEEDEFPVPAIAFEFASERDQKVRVRLSDQVPDGVAVEDLGFHPEYGSEYWTIDDDTITFERDLGAGAEYTTVYGIRATGADDVEQFLTEPVIEEVDPPLPEDQKPMPTNDGGDEVIPQSDDDVVRDVIAGKGEVPGLEDEGTGDEEADDEEIEKLDLADPNDSGSAEREATDTETETDTETADVDVSDESIIAAIADEIRNDNVSVEDLKLIHRAIDHVSGESTSGSTTAKLEKLQSDVADLRAYTDAMEEFLDEHGTAEDLIADFENRVAEFADELESIESKLAEHSTSLEQMNDTVESVQGEMDQISVEIDDVKGEVGEVSTDVEAVSSEVTEVSADVDDVSSEVTEVSTDVKDIESTVDELDEALDDLRETVDELESEITEGDVMERIEQVESRVTDLQEWQEQIKSTFGG